MRQGFVALCIVLALLAPTAVAGSARRPEMSDPPDNLDSSTDILSAWLTVESPGLRFHIRTADGSTPEVDGDRIYWFVFTVVETGAHGAAALGYSDDVVLRGYLGKGQVTGGLDDRSAAFRRGVSFSTLANEGLARLSAELGRPSTWSATIPWDSVDGLEPGATLKDLSVGASRYDRGARVWRDASDRASTDAPFLVKRQSPIFALTGGALPVLVPSWVIPAILLATTSLGLAAGFAFGRPSPDTEALPVAATPGRDAPRKPGERFRRDPTRTKV